MTHRDTYLIVAHVPASRLSRSARHRRPGRHRWNPRAARHANTRWPGSAHLNRPNLPPLRFQRGRHRRRPERPMLTMARQAAVLAVLVAVAVSGWFTASGATALAQMTHP
jgi:hypothetical protein